MSKVKHFNYSGISIFEILVVLTIFAILAALATQTLVLTLRGAKKSSALGDVRENVGYTLSVIERQIHNATLIDPCPNPDTAVLSFLDTNGIDASFSCVDTYIASSSARLTSEDIIVTSCSFECVAAVGNVLPSVTVSVRAQDAHTSGANAASVDISTKIFLRNY